MNKVSAWLLGAGIGAGFMYFLDPNMGDRRKAMVRDQVSRMTNQTDDFLEKSYRDLRNRAQGLLAETTSRLSSAEKSTGMPDIAEREAEQPMQRGTNWSPSTRLLAGLGAATLFFAGRRRGGLIGAAFSMASAGLAFRAVTNMEISRALGLSEEKGVIHVNKGINIDVPVHEVYNYWSNFENFPRFMEHVHEIHKTDDTHSHWVVQGPAGVPVEFDVITTRDEPDNIIAWETMPEAEVSHRGRVRFREAADGTTQVNVNMWYTPPAGAIGHAIASIFGVDPKQAMDDDLARLKSLLEEGKTTAKGQEVQA